MTFNAATGAAALKSGPMTFLVVGAGADAAAQDAATIAGVERVRDFEAPLNPGDTTSKVQSTTSHHL